MLTRWAALVVAVGSGILLIAVAQRHSWWAVLLVVVATLAGAALAVGEQRTPRLGLGPILAALVLLLAVAVARPPRASADLWSYAMYGRIVSVHHDSPYDALPVKYRSDPIFHHVNHIWRHRGSVFGPVYVGFAAAGTALAGDSALGNRLFFQITAALAAAAMLLVLWRRTRSPSALVWLGLNPVFVAAVNGGHNDLLVGLGILAAALLAARGRGLMAGFVIGLVSLIKLTTLFGLVGIVLWAWRRNERRVASNTVVMSTGVLLLGYLPLVGGAARVLGGADKTVTTASVWNPVAELLIGHDAGRDLAHPLAPNLTLTSIFYASMITAGALAVYAGWRASRAERPERAVGTTTAAYTFAAEYTYPWYAMWALPVLSLTRRSPITWLVWAQAALMLAAVRMPLYPRHTVLETAGHVVLIYVAPLVCLAAFAFVVRRVDGAADTAEVDDLVTPGTGIAPAT